MYKVLVTDPISDKGLAIITDAGLESVYEPALSPDELNAAVVDVHGSMVARRRRETSRPWVWRSDPPAIA